MAANPSLNPNLRNRLTRYLHTGQEVPKYYPGCWTSHKYFEEHKLEALEEAFQQNKDNVEVVNIIVKAYKDGFFTRYETIAFALTKCLLLGGVAVKEAGYKAVSDVCQTSEELMFFTKLTRLMKTGNGQGWCKSIKNWYTSKDPLALAKEVTRVRARHGRSHKLLIRKSHVKIAENDNARHAVVKYAIFGFKRAKQLLANKEGTEDIFNYIQQVEDMRHCEDPAVAAIIATQNQFTLDYVPAHLLSSQDVWNAVIPQMSLSELLRNIQRLHNMAFLTADSATTAIVISMLSNNELIKKSRITPIEVYITLCNYKNMSRPLSHEKAKITLEKELRRRTRQVFNEESGLWEWTVSRRHPKELKHWGIDRPPNQAVLLALNKLLEQSWALTPPTGARYMITLDMRHHMFKGRHFCKSFVVPRKGKRMKAANGKPAPAPAPAPPAAPASAGDSSDNAEKKSKKRLLAECFYNKHITPGHAAIVLALDILKREQNVRVAVFNEDSVHTVRIERDFSSVAEAEFILRKANLGRVQLDSPIQWAMKNKEKVDVFVHMIDRPSRYMELETERRGGRGQGGRYGPPPPPGKDAPDRCPVRALERYRVQNNVPNAKLIVLSLASKRSATTDGSHEGVFDVAGIDEHVPRVMDAFVKGQFL